MPITVSRLTPAFAARIDGATRHRRLMQRTTVGGDPAGPPAR